jgi:hypothetical protein
VWADDWFRAKLAGLAAAGVAAEAQKVRKAGSPRKRAAAAKPTPEPAPAPASESVLEADEPEIVQRLDAPSKWSGAVVAGGLMLVAGLSFFAIRGITRRK